jgi:MraZ protein
MTSPPPLAPPLPKTSEKKSESSIPSWSDPKTVTTIRSAPDADHDSAKTQPGEPPLAPAPGPVQLYHVHGKETLQEIARRTLGTGERWVDLHKLNPTLKPDEPLGAGTTVRLPADACVQSDDAEPVKPLPLLRCKPPAPKAKVLPLTGTYQCSLDEKGQLTLPRSIRDQLNGSDTVLLSPGPDKCLWLTNQHHLERLGERLDQSQANEADVRVFKRLYFAQTEKLAINGDGRVTIPERLGQFAGLHQEVVLVGIDDHFEVWDAARWRSYTQQKSAGHSATVAEGE